MLHTCLGRNGQNSAYLFFRIEFCIKVDIEHYQAKRKWALLESNLPGIV